MMIPYKMDRGVVPLAKQRFKLCATVFSRTDYIEVRILEGQLDALTRKCSHFFHQNSNVLIALRFAAAQQHYSISSGSYPGMQAPPQGPRLACTEVFGVHSTLRPEWSKKSLTSQAVLITIIANDTL